MDRIHEDRVKLIYSTAILDTIELIYSTMNKEIPEAQRRMASRATAYRMLKESLVTHQDMPNASQKIAKLNP